MSPLSLYPTYRSVVRACHPCPSSLWTRSVSVHVTLVPLPYNPAL